jgi:hypothetical protein
MQYRLLKKMDINIYEFITANLELFRIIVLLVLIA